MVRCKGTVQQHQKNIYSRPMWDCLSERCSPHKLRQAAQRFMYYSDLFSNSVFLVLHEKDLTGWFVKCTSGWRQRLPKTFLWEPSGVASSQAICTHLYMGWTCVTSDWPLIDLFPLRCCVTWMSCLRGTSCRPLLIPAGPTASTRAYLSSDRPYKPTPGSWITPCSTAALMVRHDYMFGLRLTRRERCVRWILTTQRNTFMQNLKKRQENVFVHCLVFSLWLFLSVSLLKWVKMIHLFTRHLFWQ